MLNLLFYFFKLYSLQSIYALWNCLWVKETKSLQQSQPREYTFFSFKCQEQQMVIWYEECERYGMYVKRYQTSHTFSICAAKVGFQDLVALHPVSPLYCTYIKARGALLYSEDIIN